MEGLFSWLVSHASSPAVLGALLILWALDKTGFIPRYFGGRREERTSEREQLSEDTKTLIDTLTSQLEQQREWRDDDNKYYLEQIRYLRNDLTTKDKIISNLSEAAVNSERGNARLRHALNNVFQYVGALRRRMIRSNVPLEPYTGWESLLGISDDLDKYLQDLFDTVNRISDEPKPASRKNGNQ